MALDLTASAVAFDLDGTLIDSTAVVEAIWSEYAAAQGLKAAEILAYFHGRQAIDTLRRFRPDLDITEREAVAAALLRDQHHRIAGVTAVPGARELVAALLQGGVPLALVTSAPRELALSSLQSAGVGVPPVLVTAEDVRHGKPDPEGYVRATELLGVAPEACLVFEDAEAGLAAAIGAGTQVVVVGGYESAVTRDLTRLPDFRGLQPAWNPNTGILRLSG